MRLRICVMAEIKCYKSQVELELNLKVRHPSISLDMEYALVDGLGLTEINEENIMIGSLHMFASISKVAHPN